MRKIIWTNYAGNEAVLQRVNEKINIQHTIERKKGKWIGYIFRMKCPLNAYLKNVKEGNTRKKT